MMIREWTKDGKEAVMRAFLLKLVVAFALVLLFSGAAHAGGAAVVVLDEVPTGVQAGETLHLRFMVRQHGHDPVDEFPGVGPVRPYLEARNLASGETLRVDGYKQEGAEVGRFVLDVTFPTAGTWEWRIRPDPFELMNHFEPLTIQPATVENRTVEGIGATASLGMVRSGLRWGGIALFGIACLVALTQRRWIVNHA
jgi:hypothetical protein